MVVKVFIGEEFSEHEHEWNQFNEVYKIISEKYAASEDTIYLLSNFLLSNTQIDLAILTERGPVLLDLKSYKGQIIGNENGAWKVITETGEEVKLHKNLFQQLKDQRFSFIDKLTRIRKENFEHIDEEKLARIKCWGYFEKGSSYDASQVDGRTHKWFSVITADELIPKLRFVNADYLLRKADMDAIVKGLNLKEYAESNETETLTPASQEIRESLRHIAHLAREDIGKSEENVKQKIVVPLLETLGHHRDQLDFERTINKYRVDIFREFRKR